MHPTPAAITAIQAAVAATGNTIGNMTASAVVTLLNVTTTVTNPAAQGQVPNPLSEMALMSLLTDPTNGSAAKLMAWPNLGLLKADIDSGNRQGILDWAVKLSFSGVGIITTGEAASITNYVNGTMADPTYLATIPASVAAIGRLIDTNDALAAGSQS